jgi:hypothetical protein
MKDSNDIMCHVRESFSGLHMEVPVEDLFAKSRVYRRRRLTGLTTAAAATAVVAATAMILPLGRPAPARPGNPPPASSGPVRLTAFSMTDGPGESTTLTLHKGPQYPPPDPSALRVALARHGIPALVTVGTFCRSGPTASSGAGKVVNPAGQPDGQALVIDGKAIPPGMELSIGLFPRYTRMLLIKDGAPLTCSSTLDQPAAHIPPTGTPIRGSQSASHK